MTWRRSLFGRLLLLSMAATAVALLIAGYAIGGVLERFATRGLDDRLDAQILLLAAAVTPQGALDAGAVQRLPGFDADRGWSWRVSGPDGRVWASGDGARGRSTRRGAGPRPGRDGEPRPGEGRDTRGERVHLRELTVSTPAGPVEIAAAAPRRLADRPIRAALAPLLLSLLLLGVALTGAALLQLRLGLKPLRDLRAALARVRAGEAARVPADQPRELLPLTAELNALLDQNEAQLARARGHVANLAHGIKTPLAALIVRLEEPGRAPDGSLRALAERADARVRHHLGRARAAARGPGDRSRVALPALVADLFAALRRIHAERPVTASADVPPGASVAADAEDVSEMLGNLLDNAWRHAASRVRLAVAVEGKGVSIDVDDDGPGLGASALADALVPGRRLDERGDGHGFGLPIARELAELAGGALALGRSATLGGLSARLTLPR